MRYLSALKRTRHSRTAHRITYGATKLLGQQSAQGTFKQLVGRSNVPTRHAL